MRALLKKAALAFEPVTIDFSTPTTTANAAATTTSSCQHGTLSARGRMNARIAVAPPRYATKHNNNSNNNKNNNNNNNNYNNHSSDVGNGVLKRRENSYC